jgi:hypothetical protein
MTKVSPLQDGISEYIKQFYLLYLSYKMALKDLSIKSNFGILYVTQGILLFQSSFQKGGLAYRPNDN